ncbi:MAG: hypothetical protein ACTTIM_00780 [Campylobacter sp.]
MRRVNFEFRLNFWCENWGKFEREICFKIWLNLRRKKSLQRVLNQNYAQNFRVNLVSIWK